jgi:hypothetical protein
MHTLHDLKWSDSEKKAARAAFDLARQRDYRAFRQRITAMVQQASGEKDDDAFVWRLHDYLRKTCRDMDEKYDFRYSVLIYIFARLVREGLLSEQELAGLREEKLEMIRRLVSI